MNSSSSSSSYRIIAHFEDAGGQCCVDRRWVLSDGGESFFSVLQFDDGSFAVDSPCEKDGTPMDCATCGSISGFQVDGEFGILLYHSPRDDTGDEFVEVDEVESERIAELPASALGLGSRSNPHRCINAPYPTPCTGQCVECADTH